MMKSPTRNGPETPPALLPKGEFGAYLRLAEPLGRLPFVPLEDYEVVDLIQNVRPTNREE